MLLRLLPFILLIVLGGVIYWLGSGSFGRAQTQAWIDRCRKHPRVFQILDKHHGAIRALAHYVEFGGLFLVLYWCWDAAAGEGRLAWSWVRAAVCFALSTLAAYLDEVHQLKSGTRQFRRVDFLYSLCGISIAAGLIFYQALFRGAFL